MKTAVRVFAIVAIALMVVGSFAQSQDLATQLSKLGSDAAKGYVGPILSGWAADLNSGFYHSADLHDILGFDVGIKIGLSRPADEDKTYSFDMPNTVTVSSAVLGLGGSYPGATVTLNAGSNYVKQVTANSAVGAKDETLVLTTGGTASVKLANGTTVNNVAVGSGKTIATLPGGFNLPAVPLPVPQVNVGLPLGIEAMVRFIPTVKAGDAGKFSMTGFGARYDIDQWIPLFPIDIAAHFMTQKFNFKDENDKDVLSGTATAYGLEVSKKLLFITLYGGYQIEKGSFTVASFTGTNPATGVKDLNVPEFTVEGKNTSRATVGLRMLLLLVNVHAEYSFAKVPTAAVGVGISLR